MKRRKAIDKGIVVLLLIVVVVAVASVFLVFQLRTNDVAEAIREGDPIVTAILVNDGERLLATEVLVYHPLTAKAAIFDIPGEWGDVIETVGRMDRIDLLYSGRSPATYIEKIEDLLDIAIPWYLEMNLEQVEATVDLLGGIEMFIANPVEMITDEKTVLLPSGSLVLDGAKIVEFLSYEDTEEADLDRRARFQKYVQALVSRIGVQRDFVLSDPVFAVIYDMFSTNLSNRSFRSFVEEIANLNADYMVPKHVRGERVVVDEQELLFPHFKGNLIREGIRQTLVSLANIEVIGDDELTVVLDIRNGTEINGLASRTAQLFVDFGYDVLPASNAENFDYENTRIISISGDISKAQLVASLIRCSRVEIAAESLSGNNGESFDERADVTIILGKDFDGRFCKE